MTKFGEFDITKFAARCDTTESTLLPFLYWFTPAIIGPKQWKAKCVNENYSNVMTVSDEMFLYFMVETNCNKWDYMRNCLVRVLFDTSICSIQQ